MKIKTLYIIVLFLFPACTYRYPFTSNQKIAEKLVKHYLDSTLKGEQNYTLGKFSKLDTIFSSYDEDVNYKKYKNDPTKIDSIKKHFKPYITGWTIDNNYKVYVKDGHPVKRDGIFRIDTGLTKVLYGSEIVE